MASLRLPAGILNNTLICKYHELFSIVNGGSSIDRDTKMAVSLSPNASILYQTCDWVTCTHTLPLPRTGNAHAFL